MDLVDLKDTFIPKCFEGRGWDKLLSDLLGVCEPLISEFYANAVLKEDEINCWIKGKDLTIDAGDLTIYHFVSNMKLIFLI